MSTLVDAVRNALSKMQASDLADVVLTGGQHVLLEQAFIVDTANCEEKPWIKPTGLWMVPVFLGNTSCTALQLEAGGEKFYLMPLKPGFVGWTNGLRHSLSVVHASGILLGTIDITHRCQRLECEADGAFVAWAWNRYSSSILSYLGQCLFETDLYRHMHMTEFRDILRRVIASNFILSAERVSYRTFYVDSLAPLVALATHGEKPDVVTMRWLRENVLRVAEMLQSGAYWNRWEWLSKNVVEHGRPQSDGEVEISLPTSHGEACVLVETFSVSKECDTRVAFCWYMKSVGGRTDVADAVLRVGHVDVQINEVICTSQPPSDLIGIPSIM